MVEGQIFCPTCCNNVRSMPRIGVFEAYKKMWTSAFDFKGRARRSEYLYAILINTLISNVLTIVISAAPFLAFLPLVYSLAVIIPGLSLAVRRLHDTDRSGHWLWLNLTVFGAIAVIAFIFQDRKQPYNRFGKSPKWYSVYDLNGG